MEYKGSKEFVKCERRGEIYADSSADYTLPDYNGDVRRILFAHAEIHPSGSFENGDSVDFSGIVAYDIVYSDSENKINSASFSSDYDFTVKCNPDGFVSANAEISVADFSLRLLGPRKFSARATVVADTILLNSESAAPVGEIFDAGDAEVDNVQLDIYYSERCEEFEREYAEEICRLDGAVIDEVNVIYSGAECVLDSVTPDGDGLNAKGNMRVYALVQNADGAVIMSEKSVRVDEHIPFVGDHNGLKLLPIARVGSVRHSVNADESGCSVVANIILCLSAECVGNKRVELVSDAYSKGSEVENSYSDFRFDEVAALVSEKDDFSFSVERENLDIENPREITVLRADAVIENCFMEEGMVNIVGEIRYSGIASGVDSNGNVIYYPFKNSSEFAKNVNVNCQNSDNLSPEVKIICRNPNAVIDEREINLSCVADIEIRVMRKGTVTVLETSKIIERSEFDGLGTKITVYYPERGERLFDIAKKFHTTVEKISADNAAAVRAMSEGEPAAPARLLIY